jgi:hypothetical protein
MSDQTPDVLKEKGPRALIPNDFLNVKEECSTGIREPLLLSCLAERLTRKTAAKDIEIWDALLGVDLSDVPCEILVIVSKQLRIILTEVMLVGLSRCRVPFTSENALGACSVIESDVESTDSGEKIDELVGGLLGHAPPKHN